MFQKRHLEAVAKVLCENQAITDEGKGHHLDLVEAFADLMAEHNDNFKRDLFMKACSR